MTTHTLQRIMVFIACLLSLLYSLLESRPALIVSQVLGGIALAGLVWLIYDEIMRRRKGQ